MKFSYRARTEEGEVQSGVIEASSRESALEILNQYGLYATFLSSQKAPLWQRQVGFLKEASKKDIVSFTRQLSIMMKSDISLTESFETIGQQTKKPGFKEKIFKMAEKIESGSTLSQTLSEYPKFFSPFYIGMVKSGETSGGIAESLDHLTDYLEKQQGLMAQLAGAMAYPIFVLIVFVAMIFLISSFVVPSFEDVFTEMGTDLPLLTEIVIGFSKAIRKAGWLIFLGFFGLIAGLVYFLKQKKGREFLDDFLLGLPVIGNFLAKLYLARIALNLSTLISGAVPISQALEITGDVVGNKIYQEIIAKTREGVMGGRTISSVLSSYPERFPFLFIQMVVVGEKTGHLEKSLSSIVEFYEKEVDRTLDSIIKLIEPVLMVVLGGLVGLLAMSLFVPLFQEGAMGL